MQSLDSYISGRFGIDNHLCAPWRSTSWWGLIVIVFFIIAESWRHFSVGKWNVTVFAAIALGFILLYTVFRLKVQSLAVGLREEQIATLRLISAICLSITGTAIAACVFGITRL